MRIFLRILPCVLLSFSTADALDWEKEVVDTRGAKPSLVLDNDNQPMVAFMLEDFRGFVKFSRKQNGVWTVEQVSEGYFYGPLDITADAEGIPVINYHDHTTEDQTIARLSDGAWDVNNISNPGHDGWDNNIRYAPDGTLHTLTTDPVGFGGEGLEFASFINGRWQVELVGTGPIMYAEGISFAIDSQNRPHISYHNSNTKQLFYGVRDSILWSLTPADETPESGMFSSIALTAADEPIISYIAFNAEGDAEVRLTRKNGSVWESERVDTLTHLTTGFFFARNATRLALDPQDHPAVAYTDEDVIKFARKVNDEWQIEIVDTLENNAGSRLGQQVDLKRGTDGSWHIISFDVTNSSPLYGNILYYSAADTATRIEDWKKK